jgi:ABC-type dipeptide/oligopeptide/nickel transport system ATPase component
MIEVRGLSKRYGEKIAVNNLSFSVAPGKVTGFLGPNGAGKTTTMRLILGLDYPSAGTVAIHGKNYANLAYPMREVGALIDAKAVHGGRSAYNHLLCLAQTNNLPKRRVGEVLELVGLTEVARKRPKGFSLGMSQRLGIAGTLLGDPAGPGGDPVDPQPDEGAGGRGPHGVRVQPPDVGDGAHRGSADRDRPRPAARRLHHGGVHRPQFRPDRPGVHAPA